MIRLQGVTRRYKSHAGERVALDSVDLTVGKAGFLVVVEHSVEGTLRPIFPRDGNVASAQVKAGQKVVIPEPSFTSDQLPALACVPPAPV